MDTDMAFEGKFMIEMTSPRTEKEKNVHFFLFGRKEHFLGAICWLGFFGRN